MRLLLLVAAHGLVPSIRKAPLRYRATAADLAYMREALALAETVSAERHFLSTWLSGELPEIEDPYEVLGTPQREVR